MDLSLARPPLKALIWVLWIFPTIALGQIPFQLKQSNGKSVPPRQLSREVEQGVFELSNDRRNNKKLGSLSNEDLLDDIARSHSQDMLKRNYLSHFSPEGRSLVHRYQKQVGNARRSLGENVHMIESSQGLRDPQAIANQVVTDWMRSPTHRKNILSKNYLFMGVGCVSDGNRIFCTQIFAGPKYK